MANHSSILAWRIPWTEEPGGLLSMGSHSQATPQTQRQNAQLLLLLLSHFSRVQLCATPQTAAHQVPLSTGFSRQEYWCFLNRVTMLPNEE